MSSFFILFFLTFLRLKFDLWDSIPFRKREAGGGGGSWNPPERFKSCIFLSIHSLSLASCFCVSPDRVNTTYNLLSPSFCFALFRSPVESLAIRLPPAAPPPTPLGDIYDIFLTASLTAEPDLLAFTSVLSFRFACFLLLFFVCSFRHGEATRVFAVVFTARV